MPQKPPVVDDFIPDDFEPEVETKRPLGASGSWAPAEDPRLAETRQLMGIDPLSIGDKFIGAAKSILKTGQAGLRLGQSALGLPVSPNRDILEPTNPAQRTGQTVGTIAQYGALGGIGGASLPVQVAIGGLGSGLIAAGQDQDPTLAAGIGMGAPLVGRAASVLRGALRAKDNPARALNATMEVNPADVSPSRSPGKRLLDEGDLSLRNMGLTKENLHKLLKIRRQETGVELGNAISRAPAIEADIAALPGMETPQAQAVLNEMKLSWTPPDPLTGVQRPLMVSPQQAHTMRVMLGDKINWSADARAANDATGSNEALKGLYRELNNFIESRVPGIKALNAKWADYHIGEKATEWALKRQTAMQPGMPGSTLMSVAHRITGASPLTTTYAPISRALRLPVTTPGGMVRATATAADRPNIPTNPPSNTITMRSMGNVTRARAIQQSAVTGDDAVLQAISELGGESGNPVGIAALRDRLPNLTKQQLDSAIERLSQDKIHVSRQDHPIDDPAEMARSRASGKWVAVSLRR